MKKIIRYILVIVLIAVALSFAVKFYLQYANENRVLKEVISRLEADSRVAEVLVTGVNYNDRENKVYTTIKFLEYDVNEKPLTPRYVTFSGNIIQFQSLVMRFDDMYIRSGDKLRNKSAYIFWKAFMLDGSNTQEYEITKINEIPEGYRAGDGKNTFESKLWEKFWKYALDPKESGKTGIKNAQIEAPGTMFIPGVIYTIRIEHDGGMRIDASPLPGILRGEQILK